MELGLREALRRAVEGERLYGPDHLAPVAPPVAWITVVAAPEEYQGPCGALLERMLTALRLPATAIRRALPGGEGRGEPSRVRLYLVREPQGPRAEGERGDEPGSAAVATYAPSRLLTQPELKAHVWSDLKRVMEILGLPIP